MEIKCDICSKTFMKKKNIIRHMVIHQSNRHKFQCTQCVKSYMSRSTLNMHIKKKHQLSTSSTSSVSAPIAVVSTQKSHFNEKGEEYNHFFNDGWDLQLAAAAALSMETESESNEVKKKHKQFFSNYP
jgi:Zinc finger, C2H2 type